ncbi:MAG: GntR family transcriptional regulator [Fibrobacterota bacterium]
MKHIDIAEKLQGDIEKGIYLPGKKIPHTHALASQFSASPVTIFKAVTFLAREGWVKRVKSQGTFVVDRTHKPLPNMGGQKRIGFAFNGTFSGLITTHFLAQSFMGAEETLGQAGKRAVVLPMEDKPLNEYLDEIATLGISGVLAHSLYNPSLYKGLKHRNIPVVCLDYINYGHAIDQVTIDHLKAGALALRKLHGLGHRNVLFFGNRQRKRHRNDPDHEYWWQAVQAEAHNLRSIKTKPHFIPFDDTAKMRERMRNALLDQTDATGYICASTTYFELLKTIVENEPLLEKGTRDLVLFSDWHEAKKIAVRKIHQCRWDTREMGRMAAEILLSNLKGGPHKPQIHYLPVEIS